MTKQVLFTVGIALLALGSLKMSASPFRLAGQKVAIDFSYDKDEIETECNLYASLLDHNGVLLDRLGPLDDHEEENVKSRYGTIVLKHKDSDDGHRHQATITITLQTISRRVYYIFLFVGCDKEYNFSRLTRPRLIISQTINGSPLQLQKSHFSKAVND